MSNLSKKLTSLLLATLISHPVVAQNEVIFRYNPGVIGSNSPAINPLQIEDLYVGESLIRKATLSGGAGVVSWSHIGDLPTGLAFDQDGTLHGTPSETGSFDGITLVAIDENGAQTYYSGISISVYGQLNGTTLTDRLDLGGTASVTVPVTGGKSPISFFVDGGSLPTGLTIAGNTISGTPTTIGDYQAAIEVVDANKRSVKIDVNLSIAPPLNVAANLGDAYVGESYSGSFDASGGSSIYTWTADNLPAGLTINSSDGAISGSVLSPGTFDVIGHLSDGYKFRTLEGRIEAYHLPEIASKVYADPYVGSQYSSGDGVAPNTAGGKLPLTYSAIGLPAGFSISPTTGLISGIVKSSG